MVRVSLVALTLLLFPGVQAAGETRERAAHEHGSGALGIAIEDTKVVMVLEVPGADIVGFEYAAESKADRAAVEAAVAELARPLELFVFPAAAECAVTAAGITIVGKGGHHHRHKGARDRAGTRDSATGHASHNHSEASHADKQSAHNEFHADYAMTCADPAAIDRIEFTYFARFQNSVKLDVLVVSAAGAQTFEVTRTQPGLDLSGSI